jgi:transcriptional regulator with XRE-family HTH domain
MTLPQILAKNLIELRHKQNLTQTQLSKKSSVPRSTLAQLESGNGNPSIDLLTKISLTLGVPVDELLSRPRLEIRKWTKEERQAKGRTQKGGVIFPFLLDRSPGIEFEQIQVEPGGRLIGVPHLQGAKEYLAVLEGKLQLHVSGERFDLVPGDVIAFPGDRAHSYYNIGTKTVTGVSLVFRN